MTDDLPTCTSARKGLVCAKRQHELGRHVGIDHDGSIVWWSRSLPVVQPASSAYLGDECIGCGMMVMIRTGTCSTCTNCGTSGGCG